MLTDAKKPPDTVHVSAIFLLTNSTVILQNMDSAQVIFILYLKCIEDQNRVLLFLIMAKTQEKHGNQIKRKLIFT